jgi:hypothetical protein
MTANDDFDAGLRTPLMGISPRLSGFSPCRLNQSPFGSLVIVIAMASVHCTALKNPEYITEKFLDF